MKENAIITSFLQYYCQPTHNLSYATLLKGGWGSGKTFFMKTFEKENPQFRYLHVSLYGVESLEEIDEMLLQKIHPVFSHHSSGIGNKILRSAIKNVVVSVEEELSSSLSSSGSIPSFLQNTGSYILIFDDLERCKVSIDDILGYVNSFVEFHQQRVILIANEQEIVDPKYFQIKEKIIGKTFEVRTSTLQAISVFINALEEEKYYSFMRAKTHQVIDILHRSGYKNLRIIQQSINDFEYFYSVLKDEVRADSNIINKVFYEFFAYCLEIKKGKITHQDIIGLLEYRSGTTGYRNYDTGRIAEEKYKKIIDKYSLGKGLFSLELVSQIFFEGKIIPSEINSMLIKNIQSESMSSWKKILFLWEQSDESFQVAKNKAWNDFIQKKYDKLEEMLHVVAFFLFLAEGANNFVAQTEIGIKAREYVDVLDQKGLLYFESDNEAMKYKKYDEIEFLGHDDISNTEWKKTCQYIHELEEKNLPKRLETYANKKFLPLLSIDIPAFQKALIPHGQKIVEQNSFLQYLDAGEFFIEFLRLSSPQKIEIIHALRMRFRPFEGYVEEEIVFLQSLQSVVLTWIQANSTTAPLTVFLLQYHLLKKCISPLLSELKSREDSRSILGD